jgi:hypothetical protein
VKRAGAERVEVGEIAPLAARALPPRFEDAASV